MYKYGNLLFDKMEGWMFIEKDGEKADLEDENFIDALNTLGKDGWDLIHFEEEIGYILKKKEEK